MDSSMIFFHQMTLSDSTLYNTHKEIVYALNFYKTNYPISLERIIYADNLPIYKFEWIHDNILHVGIMK